MLTLPKLLGLCVIIAPLLFLYNSIRMRERAVSTGKRYCREFGYQLLDDTVRRDRAWLVGDVKRGWRIARQFRFEYSDDGVTRKNGAIVMLRGRVQLVEFDGQRVLQ